MSIQANILFGIVQKKFNKLSGLKVETANVNVDYLSDTLTIKFVQGSHGIKKTDKISNNSEMSEMLLNKINDKSEIKFKKIDLIVLDFDFVNKSCKGSVYFINDIGEKCHYEMDKLF